MYAIGMLALLLLAIAANLVHGNIGAGYWWGGGREGSWAVTLALFAGTLVCAGYAVRQRWDGVFIDRDNRISLARFQLILWTLLLVSALLSAGLLNALTTNCAMPLDIAIEPQVWALLGLGAFSAVAAPAIKDGRRGPGARPGSTVKADAAAARLHAKQNLTALPALDGDVLVKAAPADARWIDLIYGDYQGSDYVDVSKLQQLAFTVLLVAVYAMALTGKFAEPKHAAILQFPTIGGGFLALLGISHAAYLTDKQVASS